MIFDELERHLQLRKDIRYGLIIDNKLVTFEDKTADLVYVSYTSLGLEFGRKGSGTTVIEPEQEAADIVAELLSPTGIGELDFGEDLNIDHYTVHVNNELKTVIITTAALSKIANVLVKFDGTSGVQVRMGGYQVVKFTEQEFLRVFKDIVSMLYERFREGALNHLIRKILYRPELKNRAAVNLVRVKHVFVTVFFHVDGIYQPSDFAYIRNQLKGTLIYKMTEAYGVHFELNDATITLLTHKEVCEAFHLKNFVTFNSMLIQDMIYSELLDGTPTHFDRGVGGVYLLYGKARSPETKLIVYEPDDDYIEVNQFAVRLVTNKSYRDNAYNTLRYINDYSL